MLSWSPSESQLLEILDLDDSGFNLDSIIRWLHVQKEDFTAWADRVGFESSGSHVEYDFHHEDPSEFGFQFTEGQSPDEAFSSAMKGRVFSSLRFKKANKRIPQSRTIEWMRETERNFYGNSFPV